MTRACLRLTNLDDSISPFLLPAARSAGVMQVFGIAEGYAGSVDLAGYPVKGIQICGIGPDIPLGVSIIGFAVPLPPAS